MFKKVLLIVSTVFIFAMATFAQGTSTAATSSEAPVAEKKATFRSTKTQVQEAQEMLKEKKLYTGETSGSSSPEWKTAVKAYQGDNGLAKTGTLNRATLEKMGIKLTDKQQDIPADPKQYANEAKGGKTTDKSKPSVKTAAETSDGPKRPAPFQATKDQITALQTKLKEAKMFTGEADGKRSDSLKAAVKTYQESNGLKGTGGINAATLGKMGIELTDKQKEQVAAQAAYDAAKAGKN